MGADFVEALGHFVAGELVAGDEVHLDGGEIDDGVAGKGGERGGAEEAEAVVDVVHRGRAVFLVVADDLAAGELDVGGVVAAVVFVDGHQALAAGGEEVRGHGVVVDGEVAVAVEDVEGVAELGEGLDEGAAGAEEFGAVEAVVDFDAPFCAVAVELDDLFAEVADAEDDMGEAGGAEEAELMGEERLAGDLDEELGDFFRDRAEAGGHAAGEEGDGERSERQGHRRGAHGTHGIHGRIEREIFRSDCFRVFRVFRGQLV